MFNSKKRVKDMSAPGAPSGSAGAASSQAAGIGGGLPGFGPTSAGNIQKLEMAKRLALKINAQKNLGAEAQVSKTGLTCLCFFICLWVRLRKKIFFTLSNMSSPVVQDVMQQATNAILRGGTIITPSVSAKTIAEQLAEKINAKLNYTPVEKLEEERQAAEQVETVTRYEEELEINDFPQVSVRLLFFSDLICFSVGRVNLTTRSFSFPVLYRLQGGR